MAQTGTGKEKKCIFFPVCEDLRWNGCEGCYSRFVPTSLRRYSLEGKHRRSGITSSYQLDKSLRSELTLFQNKHAHGMKYVIVSPSLWYKTFTWTAFVVKYYFPAAVLSFAASVYWSSDTELHLLLFRRWQTGKGFHIWGRLGFIRF
jgi:hypothetical protein